MEKMTIIKEKDKYGFIQFEYSGYVGTAKIYNKLSQSKIGIIEIKGHGHITYKGPSVNEIGRTRVNEILDLLKNKYLGN